MAGFQKNVSGQKWMVFAFDETDNTKKTGDAANITGKIRKDYGEAAAITDTNPTEIEDGYYEFDLSQAETNANVLDILPESSTANIQVIGCPVRVFTVPANFTAIGIESDGHAHADVKELAGSTIQQSGGRPEVNLTHIMGTILTEGGAGRLAAAFIKLLDVATPALVASDVMRGTDIAALASICTEGRLAELDAANLPADIDAILADTGTDGVVLAANDVDSTGGEVVGILKAIEVILGIAAGVADYNDATGVWTVKGRDGTTTIFTGTVTDEGDRSASTIA